MDAPHIPLIVEVHAEEAAILWLQRDRAVEAPHFNRMFLSRLDERLEANVDGLLVAGRAGWDIARAAYDKTPEAGEAFALAALAFAAGSARGIGEILEIVEADDEGAVTRAVISALGWLAPDRLNGRVQPLLSDQRAKIKALGLGACSAHRVDPGEQLGVFLKADTPLRRNALKLAGQLGRADLCDQLLVNADVDAECEFLAAWAAVLLGDRGTSLDILKEIAAGPSPRRLDALELVSLVLEPDDGKTWIGGLGRDAEILAVRASGRVGHPDLVPWLIGRMEAAHLARVAGESVAMITGVDFEFLDLDTTAPEEADTGPTDDPSDPNVALDPDHELPFPDPEAIASWWAKAEDTFAPGYRYFLGQRASDEAYRVGFDRGYQRQRRAAALADALAAPERPISNWRARERRLVRWKAPTAP